MVEDSGHIGVVDRAEWSSPVMRVWCKGQGVFEVREDDVVFVLRENLVMELQAIDLISGDKIISITPHQLSIKKSITGGLF